MISPKVAWGVGKGHSEVDAKRRERRRGAFEANDVNGLLPRLICSTELICATSVSRRHPSFYIWLTWVGVGWEGVVTWKEQSLILFQAPSNFCNLLDHQTHLKPRLPTSIWVFVCVLLFPSLHQVRFCRTRTWDRDLGSVIWEAALQEEAVREWGDQSGEGVS